MAVSGGTNYSIYCSFVGVAYIAQARNLQTTDLAVSGGDCPVMRRCPQDMVCI